MDNTTPSEAAGWLKDIRVESANIEQQINRLQNQLRRLRVRESALEAFLASFDGYEGETRSTKTSVRDQVVARVVEILREAGGEVHINEIHSRYINNGWKVPGRGRPNNLTAHIGTSTEIESTRLGWYRLVASDSGVRDKRLG